MATANLNNEPEQIVTGNDNIAIVQVLSTVRGGRTLDVTGFSPTLIKGGHVIIKETATGEYKPMPVTGSGAIEGLGTITPGSGYADGTYTGVDLTGGSGSGATANITVSGGEITNVNIVTKGTGYAASDSLSADDADLGGGGGTGFAVAVSVVDTTASAYGSLPGGHTYAGINIATIRTTKPFSAILRQGTVNPAACPFAMDSILAAVKTALPNIDFLED